MSLYPTAFGYVAAYGPYSYRRKVVARRVGHVLEDHEPQLSTAGPYERIVWDGEFEDYCPMFFHPKEYDDQVWPRKQWT